MDFDDGFASGGVGFDQPLGSFGDLMLQLGVANFLLSLSLKIPFRHLGEPFVFVVPTPAGGEDENGHDEDHAGFSHAISIVRGYD